MCSSLIQESGRGRANETTGSVSVCLRAGAGKPGLGGGLEGDLVADLDATT
jgi:hypothetical protein